MAAALVCTAFGAMASSALAWEDGGHASYTVNISPATVPEGGSTAFDVALTNTSASSGPNLDSAFVAAPRGFDVTGASLPMGANGTADVFWNFVVLRHLDLAPGSTVDVSVTATAPSRCSNAPRHWDVDAFTNWFEGMRLDRNDSSLTTTVSCAVPTGLEFVTQPGNTMVGQSITPAVTVQVIDQNGQPIDSSAPVTIALGANPAGGTLSGTTTENAVNGVATFSDLSIDQPGVGYTLAASSTGLNAATSNPFNESNTTTTACDPTTTTCNTDLGTSVSDLAISADPAAGSITESVDVGTPLSCADAAHGGYTGFDTNWYTFSETGTVNKTLSYELFGLTSDQEGSVRMCFGATYPFTTYGGGTSASGTLPDGSSGYIGLLPLCDSVDGVLPCVNSVAPFTDGHSGLLATVTVPGLTVNGAPADPAIHG